MSRCQFVFLTYILGVAWLGVFGFSAVPVFLFYNMWSTCATMRSPMANMTNIDSICVDVRQYGRRRNKQAGSAGFVITFCVFALKFDSCLYRNHTVCSYIVPACYSSGFLKIYSEGKCDVVVGAKVNMFNTFSLLQESSHGTPRRARPAGPH